MSARALVVALLTALFAASCSQDSPNPSLTAEPATVEGDPLSIDELTERLAQGLNATSYIEYRFDGDANGMEISGEVRMWNDPPNARFDLSSTGASFSLLDTPTGAFICGIAPECQSLTPGDAARAYVQDYIDIANGSSVVGTTTREVLGIRVDCFEVKATSSRLRFDEATICVDERGLALEMVGGKGNLGETRFVARVVSNDVDPAVFERAAIGAPSIEESPPIPPLSASDQQLRHALKAGALVTSDLPADWRKIEISVGDVGEPYCLDGYNESLSRSRVKVDFITAGSFLSQSIIPFENDGGASAYMAAWRDSVETCKAQAASQGSILDVTVVPFPVVGDETVAMRLNNPNTGSEIMNLFIRRGDVVIGVYHVVRAPRSIDQAFVEDMARKAEAAFAANLTAPP